MLHGASDVPDELVKKAISLGICKVNVATDLKIPFSNAIKEFFKANPEANDPRKYLTPAKEAMGENGAGKSTLMKCLFGIYNPNGGEIFLNGEKTEIPDAKTALKKGISMIHQELYPVRQRTVMPAPPTMG